jgi:hypothetical protein
MRPGFPEIRMGRTPRAARLVCAALATLAALAALAAPILLPLGGCGGGEEPLRYEGEGATPVPLTFYSDVPQVSARVDDGAPRALLLDTGSPATLLDPDAYPVPAGRYRPAHLATLGITFLEPPLGVLDLFGGSLDDLGVAGILGGDLLRPFALTVDYRGAVAVLFPALDGAIPEHGADLAPALQVGFSLRGGGWLRLTDQQDLSVPATRVVVPLWIEDHPVEAVLDTGATSVVLREPLYDALAAARPGRPTLRGLQVITVDGPADIELSRATSVALQDAPQQSAVTSVETLVVRGSVALAGVSEEVGGEVDALLGASYLRYFQLTVDYPARTLTLQRYPDPYHVDPDEWVGVGFTWEQTAPGQVWVDAVLPDTSAAAEGLRPGDRVLQAGDHDVTAEGALGVEQAVDASAVGEAIPFTLERDGSPYDASVLLEDLLPDFE